jgi:translocation and assembly module TamA
MKLRRNLCTAILIPLLGAASTPASAAVTFSGLDEDLERNARALMTLASVSCEASEWRVERLFRDADEQLRNALEALGYYRFNVDKRLSFENAECWSAEFELALDEPVRIRDIAVSIDGEVRDDVGFTEAGNELRPEPGSILDHSVYERYKRSILSGLTTRGYFDAELIDSSVTVSESLTYADINIHIESGSRYQFGDVTFSDGILTQKLLAGYVRFSKGDPYDAGEISRLYESLNGSGYFGSVSITAQPIEGGGLLVPVLVSLTPAKRRVYTVGVGFATDTEFQGRLGYTDRRRNDSGHQFDARLYMSKVDSELTGTYRWPRGRPDKEWASLYGGFLRKRTDTSRSDKTSLGIRVARNRTENWLETPYVDFSNEDFIVAEQAGNSRLMTPGITWETTIGRELRRVPSGHRISFDLRGAHHDLLSDATFLQATASSKWITSFGESTRFLARADLGVTKTENFEELPATVRFFTGGDTSVRGYGFETIGPVDPEGNVTGGEHLIAVSVEADWLIATKWAVAVFADTGTAFVDNNPDFKTGVGIGLRWYSPFGPIRVDIAHPLNDPERDFRLHITFGPDL